MYNKRFNTVVQFDLTDEKFRSLFRRLFSIESFSSGVDGCWGMFDSVQSQSSVIDLWRLSVNEIGEDLSFSLQDTYDTYVAWSEGLWCVFVCQLKQESYLLQVGLRVDQHRARFHELFQYFPKKNEYSNIEPGLPRQFEAVCFTPSLIPLPAASF